jgi:carbon-monoxide dehydrogenase large subunit
MGQFGVGQPVRRKEDVRLLTGKGRFTDDINLPGQLFAWFLRSAQAHAEIRSIDTSAALAAPGVVAVFTGEDMLRDGVAPYPAVSDLKDRQGKPLYTPVRRALPTDRTRYVGECLAIVVAETIDQAKDAAELIAIDFEELPVAVGTHRALEPDAPVLWPENGSNLVVHWENRDPAEVEAALRTAAKRVSVDIVNNRLIPSPMEPRAALAVYDAAADFTTLYCPSQGGRRIQAAFSKDLLQIPPDKIRVVAYDTGGGFGIRSKIYPELVAIVYAARKLARPVKWRGDRSETFVSDYHGRDQINHAEMGLDENGRVVALKVETLLNIGAFVTENGPRLPMAGGGRVIPCAYDIQNFYLSVKPMFTNQVPTDTYRGAGRPESNFIMERLMDAAAEACGLTRDEVRRRNMIPQEKLPYRTAMGLLFDSGDFAGTMDMTLEAAGWHSFEERRKESEARGRLRGIGLAYFIEGAGGRPIEEMRVRVEKDGTATVFAGTYSHGQGHETVYAQLLNEYLGIEHDKVKLVQGDSALMPKGAVGTFGSRSSMMGGVGIKRAAERLVAKGKVIAGQMLQSDPESIRFEEGCFRKGASSISLSEVAAAAENPRSLPEGMEPGLDESYVYERGGSDFLNFPNGCHICEVEVDPDLGTIEILAYTAVDDCGTVLNPLIVHGQVYGGVAQGLGQALTEEVVYDESGQLVTASYMDYGMPRAKHMPHVNALFNEVPTPNNDLGVKGAGEAGACGAPPALVSAVVDALKPFGIRHIDMPLTPERVWRAIEQAKAQRAVAAE